MHMVMQNSSEGHRDRMANYSSKILLRQNHQKSQWQLRQLACFFGVFSYAGGNTSQLPGKAISQVYSSRVPSLLQIAARQRRGIWRYEHETPIIPEARNWRGTMRKQQYPLGLGLICITIITYHKDAI